MDPLQVTLFGRFEVRKGSLLDGFSSQKVQELFCYLLIHRSRPHPREALASVLWDYCSTEQSKMYLRRVLWQLQKALTTALGEHEGSRILLLDKEWVQVHPEAPIRIDIADFESAYNAVRGIAGHHIDHSKIRAVQAAVELCTSDLLENWYHDWCLFERERLQNVYLALLDKLMDYCEAHREYELGLNYGERLLRVDRARERTHRRLMKLYYLAGNRTSALRQYQRCAAILEDELSVKPSRTTKLLYEQICADHSAVPEDAEVTGALRQERPPVSLPERLEHILSMQQRIASVQEHIQREIEAIEHALHPGSSA